MADAGFPRRVPRCPRSCYHGPRRWLRFFQLKVVKHKRGIQRGSEFSCLRQNVMIMRLATHKSTQWVVRCRPSMVHMLSLCFLKKEYFTAFGRMKSLLESSVSSLFYSMLGRLVQKLLWGFSEGGSGTGAHSPNPIASCKLVVALATCVSIFMLALSSLKGFNQCKFLAGIRSRNGVARAGGSSGK